jgi:phosphoenolpyruvate-protein phosphotransferase
MVRPVETRLQGIAGGNGIVMGPAFCYRPARLTPPDIPPQSPAAEWQRFEAAREAGRADLERLYARVAQHGRPIEAAIFDAQQLMLDDPALANRVRLGVERGQRAEQAVSEAIESLAALLDAMPADLFAARATDVRDIGRRLMRWLLGVPENDLGALLEPAIIVADDLTPSDTANLDPKLTLGFCTAGGGATSHSAILARTLGIPAVVGLGASLLATISAPDELILDAGEGVVVVNPSPATRGHYAGLRARQQTWHEGLRAQAHAPACTVDGRRVEVAANIGDVESARDAVACGAEAIGLLRTEFLYLAATQPPSEEQQLAAYRSIFAAMEGRPIIVRTLDVGGDKPPSYIDFPQEMNPFLGWRAIRLCLEETGLFKTQIRAILRAAAGYSVGLMFPMISDLAELLAARDVMHQAMVELAREGLAHSAAIRVGIMVETPAAALMIDVLAEAADFFSLGTNDLTQYTLAVDRGNTRVAQLFQPLHPAVLRLIQRTIEAAHARGKWVGLCGELASMPLAIPILLGLGLDELSMVPRAIPAAKHLIRQLTQTAAREIAAQALSLRTGAEVERYMGQVLAYSAIDIEPGDGNG